MTFGERLQGISQANDSLLCVGLDVDTLRLPAPLRDRPDGPVAFAEAIIAATADLVCAYKPNLAFYLAGGVPGLNALVETVAVIRRLAPAVPVILDAKFNDIDSTAAATFRIGVSIAVGGFSASAMARPSSSWSIARKSAARRWKVVSTSVSRVIGAPNTRGSTTAAIATVLSAMATAASPEAKALMIRRVPPKGLPGDGVAGAPLVGRVGSSGRYTTSNRDTRLTASLVGLPSSNGFLGGEMATTRRLSPTVTSRGTGGSSLTEMPNLNAVCSKNTSVL